MKARWISVAAVIAIISVALALTTQALVNDQSDTSTETLVTAAQSTPGQEAEARAKKSGCLECHRDDKKGIGPPFREVALRYKDNSGARSALIQKVKKGGKGNWGEISGGAPMPPYQRRLSEAEITRLVDWVLTLHGEDIR